MANKNLSEFVKVAPLLDEDDMASDSAAHGATQQSIKAYADAIKASISTPIFWNMLTAAPDVVGQGTWITAKNVSYLYNGIFFNSTHNNADNFTVNFRCPAGTYTLRFTCIIGTNQGIVDVDIDASEEGSFDNEGSVADVTNEIAGLTLTAGTHTLKFRIDGTTGTDHYVSVTGISFQRTS